MFAPNDTVSVQKRTTAMWAASRGTNKISKKNKQGTKGNKSWLFHRRSYAEVIVRPMARYSINSKLSIAVYILIFILLVAVDWGIFRHLATREELFNLLIE